jgi:hypothetical protein
MNLYWEQYMGPGGRRADGRHSVYIILDEGTSARLYQMPSDAELSPINTQRARKYREYGPTGSSDEYSWELVLAEAKSAAQSWEDAEEY